MHGSSPVSSFSLPPSPADLSRSFFTTKLPKTILVVYVGSRLDSLADAEAPHDRVSTLLNIGSIALATIISFLTGWYVPTSFLFSLFAFGTRLRPIFPLLTLTPHFSFRLPRRYIYHSLLLHLPTLPPVIPDPLLTDDENAARAGEGDALLLNFSDEDEEEGEVLPTHR